MANSAQLRNEIAAGKWDDKLRALYGDATQEICRQRARYCAALEQFELYFGPGQAGAGLFGTGPRRAGRQPHATTSTVMALRRLSRWILWPWLAHNTDGYVRVKSRGLQQAGCDRSCYRGGAAGRGEHPLGQSDPRHCRGLPRGGQSRSAALMPTPPAMCCAAPACPARRRFEMGMACHLERRIWLPVWPRRSWQSICQYAENTYFGKPSGLLDQLTSAVGGIIFADFADPQLPKDLEKTPRRRPAAAGHEPLRHRYPRQPQRTDRRVCSHPAGDGAGGRAASVSRCWGR